MNEPEPEPYVIHLPPKKFVSKRVSLADQKVAEEGKIDFSKSKGRSYYRGIPKWRQNKKNFNWKKTSDDKVEEETYDKPQKRFSLPSKSYSDQWKDKNRSFSKQIEAAGIIATPAKKPGEHRGQFQRSFDTFMFGSRSVLPDPPVIKSGDNKLKYKSAQELIDSAVSADKIYKYPVNDMTGTYQRSMASAILGVGSVASSPSTSETSTSSRFPPERHAPSMVPVLPNQKIKYSSSRSSINDIFGSEESFASNSDYSPRSSLLIEDCVVQGNTLKRVRNESSNQMESRKSVAGPINCLPALPPSQMEAIVSKTAEISHESQILDRVMTQYRNKRSNSSNDEKNLKPESEITEEQWFNTITLLDLPETFIKEFIKNTMQALQEKNHSEKVGITVGQISNIHSTKKVLTLRDYTGEIKALVQEKVIKAHGSMLCEDTILTLKSVTVQKSEGLPPFITITLNNIYMLYVDEYNKALGYGARIISGLGGKANNNFPNRSIQSNSEESIVNNSNDSSIYAINEKKIEE